MLTPQTHDSKGRWVINVFHTIGVRVKVYIGILISNKIKCLSWLFIGLSIHSMLYPRELEYQLKRLWAFLCTSSWEMKTNNINNYTLISTRNKLHRTIYTTMYMYLAMIYMYNIKICSFFFFFCKPNFGNLPKSCNKWCINRVSIKDIQIIPAAFCGKEF